ncbi:uncharacterized protein LOC111326510 [Stylophora pistillata]|nr:uncharacterized protein LOC111326510 [Stylophora pistillata]
MEFTPVRTFDGKRLMNHLILATEVTDREFCGARCFLEENCASYNLMTGSEAENHICELNNATHEGHESDLVNYSGSIYRAAQDACANDPCNRRGTCQVGFTQKDYRCVCSLGFTGQDCLSDIDECSEGTHSCDINADCSNTDGSYECICNPGFHGDGRNCEDIDECATNTHSCSADHLCNNTDGSFSCTSFTCKEIYDRNPQSENKAYDLVAGPEKIPIYCIMRATGMGPCGGGGWTLVMKMNGTEQTFHYDASIWTNKVAFNLEGGETGLDGQETKLPTYWNTSFSKICVGMKVPGEVDTRFIVILQTAESLYSLIADGQYRPTTSGKDAWKSLVSPPGRLQANCNKEGFNTSGDNTGSAGRARARLGILGNGEDDCYTCDSRIGFGTGGALDDSITCGNAHGYNLKVKTMGYIFVQ